MDAEALGDCERTLTREWLVTNGAGGYAMDAIARATTRDYHDGAIPASGSLALAGGASRFSRARSGRQRRYLHPAGIHLIPAGFPAQAWNVVEAIRLACER